MIRAAGRLPRREHDVIIVGAGPAGSAAAAVLARSGLDVLLLDRAVFPRRKACGECLSPQATRILRELGVLEAVEAAGPARLSGWRIVAPDGASFEASFRDVTADPGLHSALAIGRDRLDMALVEAAVRAGARLECGVRVLDLTRPAPGVLGMGPAGRFEAQGRLVVGADGLRSVVARRMGATGRGARIRKLSLTGHLVGIACDPGDVGEMHIVDGMCAGIAPVDTSANVHNVSLVVDGPRFGREVATEPIAFYQRALRSFPRLGPRVRGARFADGETRGRTGPLLTSGPFDRPTRRIVTRGYALVGDAAGYFDPFTGQGVHQALAGGLLLADEAMRGLECDSGPPLLVSYEKRYRKLIRGTRVLQRMIEAVVSRPALADRAMARLARRPAAGRALLAATGDLQAPFDAISPAVLLRFLAPWNMETMLP